MGIPAKGRDSILSVREATSTVPAFAGNLNLAASGNRVNLR
jgi:hypothetical protein